VSAQPIHHEDPRDPQVIHDRLPESVRATFLAEYHAAVDAAHTFAGYRALQELLNTWYLRSVAYAKPDFQQRYEEIRDGIGEYSTLEDVMARYAAQR